MIPEEVKKQRTKKAKISFVIAGILLALSSISWIQTILVTDYLGMSVNVILGLIFPFLSIPFIISGIWNFAIRERLSKNEKEINRLEKRLEKVEEEKSLFR